MDKIQVFSLAKVMVLLSLRFIRICFELHKCLLSDSLFAGPFHTIQPCWNSLRVFAFNEEHISFNIGFYTFPT